MEKLVLRKKKRSVARDYITYGIAIVLFIVFTLLSDGINIFGTTLKLTRSTKGMLVPICVYVTAAVALNLVVGISGELSLGHAGFMSIGAFSAAVFWHVFSGISNVTLRMFVIMFCAGIIAAFFGVLIGIPVLRLQGDYLAIVTLAFGEIIMNLLNCVYIGYDAEGWHFSFGKSLSMNGGTAVLSGPMGITSNKKAATFTVGFILVLFALFVVLNLIRSKTGRSIMAIRDNRIAAESVGLSAGKYKIIAFTVSAFLTGMAGALYIMNFASGVAPVKFNFNTSILLLVFVVLGGIGNIRGSVFAAIILTVLPEKLRWLGDYRMLIYAVLLIAMMLLTNAPWGKQFLNSLTGFFRNLKKGGKAPAAEKPDAGPSEDKEVQ